VGVETGWFRSIVAAPLQVLSYFNDSVSCGRGLSRIQDMVSGLGCQGKEGKKRKFF
jgi:hypothetical protein